MLDSDSVFSSNPQEKKNLHKLEPALSGAGFFLTQPTSDTAKGRSLNLTTSVNAEDLASDGRIREIHTLMFY